MSDSILALSQKAYKDWNQYRLQPFKGIRNFEIPKTDGIMCFNDKPSKIVDGKHGRSSNMTVVITLNDINPYSSTDIYDQLKPIIDNWLKYNQSTLK